MSNKFLRSGGKLLILNSFGTYVPVLWIDIVLMSTRIHLFILMPIRIPPQVLQLMENPKLFHLSRQCHRCHSFSILDSKIKFSCFKFWFSLYLVEMDTDPDRQALDADPDLAKCCGFDWIRIHNTVMVRYSPNPNCICSSYLYLSWKFLSVLPWGHWTSIGSVVEPEPEP